MTDLTGTHLGRYQINEMIGQGGMATVYKALDTHLEREVAVKIIRRSAFSPEVLERVLKRFDREAKSLARLNHANIVPLIDYGEQDGSPYLVMPYFPGGTLKQRMGQPVPYAQAARMLHPIAEALAFAHQKGVVHRDVKPANILFTESGTPMLSDFGVARLLEGEEGATLTGTGTGVGTPEYMSPEQGMGREIDGRADIYSLGVVLYELLTGQKPYTADTPMAVIFKHMSEPLPDVRFYVPSLPDTALEILRRSLAKQPNDRYADMTLMAAALEELSLVQSMPASWLAKQQPLDVKKSEDHLLAEAETADPVLPGAGITGQAAESGSTPAAGRPHAPRKNIWLWIIGAAGIVLLGAALLLNRNSSWLAGLAPRTATFTPISLTSTPRPTSSPQPPTVTGTSTATPTLAPTPTETRPAATATPAIDLAQTVTALEARKVVAYAFSPDSSRIVTIGMDGANADGVYLISAEQVPVEIAQFRYSGKATYSSSNCTWSRKADGDSYVRGEQQRQFYFPKKVEWDPTSKYIWVFLTSELRTGCVIMTFSAEYHTYFSSWEPLGGSSPADDSCAIVNVDTKQIRRFTACQKVEFSADGQTAVIDYGMKREEFLLSELSK